MNRVEHLLVIMMEECGEVVQDAAKALRFGLDEGRDIECTNEQRLRTEFNQLLAVVNMLKDEGIDLTFDYDVQQMKRDKVEEYLKYSIKCGTFDDIPGIRPVREEELEDYIAEMEAKLEQRNKRKKRENNI